MRQTLLLILTILLISLQEKEVDLLYGEWELKNNRSLTMVFKKEGFSIIDGEENITLKRRKNILKVTNHHRPKFKCISKDTYIYKIERLTEEELILTQNSIKNNFETLYGDTLIFYRVK